VWQLGVKSLIYKAYCIAAKCGRSVAEVWQLPHFPHCEKKIHKLMVAQGPGRQGRGYFI